MKRGEQIRLENIADTEYEIFALLKQRYSPRIFKEDMLSETHIHQLFEAARWAASSNNLQPWRFIYGERGSDAHKKICDCLSDFNKDWADTAPLLILTVYKKHLEDGSENFHALYDLGLSLGNMTVQGQYLGIGLHHMAGLDWQEAQNIFHVPNEFHIASAIAIGYYGGDSSQLPEDLKEQETAQRERMPLSSFTFNGKWRA
ncbi:nitroreductase [Zobellia amurskyensis]|uniref:Nitroreductase n=1 Tax=Zobellia amurskyensis TaxID=248905 RepID=A0A7X2ZSG2_9FLAO|nr:nitroreductase family protein [Zobellia amurskyensis]MUH35559.1 nitroreductase [Zobellia amurskyensis]